MSSSVSPSQTIPAFEPLPALHLPRPLRLGVTSFVYPADILPNVRALASAVDDIELVFFEASEGANLPSADDVQELADVAGTHDLTYTIHFPIDKALGSESATEREALLEQIVRVVDLARPLDPFGWVMHVGGIGAGASSDRRRQWQDDAMPLLDRIDRHIGAPDRVCVENLDYPFEWCDPFLERFRFAVCLDAGHLWQGGYDWRAHVARYLATTRVIHLYGTGRGTSHLSLAALPRPLIVEFLRSIVGFAGVLTIETFGEDNTRTSLERLAECLSIVHATDA